MFSPLQMFRDLCKVVGALYQPEVQIAHPKDVAGKERMKKISKTMKTKSMDKRHDISRGSAALQGFYKASTRCFRHIEVNNLLLLEKGAAEPP